MLELGRVYKWSEIVEEYPDKWATITDVDERDGKILSCRLLAVCDHSERYKYIRKYKKEGIKVWSERTTFSAPNMGFLC